MTTADRIIERTKERAGISNGVAKELLNSTEFKEKAEKAVSDLAHNLLNTATRQSKVAKKQARQLYRQSSATIKRHPWEMVGAAVVTGIFIGVLFAIGRRREE